MRTLTTTACETRGIRPLSARRYRLPNTFRGLSCRFSPPARTATTGLIICNREPIGSARRNYRKGISHPPCGTWILTRRSMAASGGYGISPTSGTDLPARPHQRPRRLTHRRARPPQRRRGPQRIRRRQRRRPRRPRRRRGRRHLLQLLHPPKPLQRRPPQRRHRRRRKPLQRRQPRRPPKR